MSGTLSPSKDPVQWHRRPCRVTPRLILTGDLYENPARALAQLEGWVANGVTDVIDLRGEHSDEAFVATHAPDIEYVWLGTHDEGGSQSDAWFYLGIAAALDALEDPDRTVLVHCHMGINRAPSMVFAILLALGWDATDALEAIRAARPIANILYAESAISWWLRHQGAGPTEVAAGVATVRRWRADNPIDVSTHISRIRRGGSTNGGN